MPTCKYGHSISFNLDVAKDTKLSLPAQLQGSHSGAGKPGNEASQIHVYYSLQEYAHG